MVVIHPLKIKLAKHTSVHRLKLQHSTGENISTNESTRIYNRSHGLLPGLQLNLTDKRDLGLKRMDNFDLIN